MDKPCILFIGNFLPIETFSKNVWHYLAENFAAKGWKIISTSSKINRFARLSDMVWTIIREQKTYQVSQIDVFSGKAFIFADVCSLLLKLLNKTIILTLHGGGLPEFAKQFPAWVKRVFSRADTIVTPSKFHINELSHIYSDIRFIPNPVDLSISLFRKRDNPLPKLVWVRAFHQIYNPTLAIEVLRIMKSSYPETALLMIGPDKDDGSLIQVEALIKKYKLEDKVHIVGGVPQIEIPRWLDQADIFINTSNVDTAPRSVLEAMANGLCVVSTNIGGLPYLIEDGKSGLLVPSQNAQAMAKAVDRLLSLPNSAAQLSENAHLEAAKHDWSRVLPLWESLFIEVWRKSC